MAPDASARRLDALAAMLPLRFAFPWTFGSGLPLRWPLAVGSLHEIVPPRARCTHLAFEDPLAHAFSRDAEHVGDVWDGVLGLAFRRFGFGHATDCKQRACAGQGMAKVGLSEQTCASARYDVGWKEGQSRHRSFQFRLGVRRLQLMKVTVTVLTMHLNRARPAVSAAVIRVTPKVTA